MPDRHGIERLRWLLEVDREHYVGAAGVPESEVVYPTRWVGIDPRQVQIEVAYALIEELHDALDRVERRRAAIAFDPTSFIPPQDPHGV
jgi:hypothetical protein